MPMFDGQLAVAEYFRVNKIGWLVPVAGNAAAAVEVFAAAHFDIDQRDTYDTD